jgi:hypothetical protein
MHRSLAPLAVAALALAAACSDGAPTHSAAPPEDGAAPLLRSPRAVPGEYIVVLNDGADPRSVAAVAGAEPGFVYTAALNGFSASLNAGQLAALRQNPAVAYVEENGVVESAATQSNATWGLDRIDQRDLPLNGTYVYTPTGSGVHAYIIDTGILLAHTQFTGRMGNGYDAVTSGGNANDCNGHGTHVAGTVGGTTYGVAKQVTLHPVRVLSCTGSGTNAGVIAGMDWVTANHVKPAVANMSLGGGASTATDDAVNRMHNAGVTVVVAAGNDNQNACNYSPARAAERHHRRLHHQQRRALLVQQLRELPGRLRAGEQHHQRLAHLHQRHQHHQRHLDGLAARGGRRRALPAGEPRRVAGHGHGRHRELRDDLQGDQRRERLAQPAGVLAAHHRRHHPAAVGHHLHLHRHPERNRRGADPPERHLLPEHRLGGSHRQPFRAFERRLRSPPVPLERLVVGGGGQLSRLDLHREHHLQRCGGLLLLARQLLQRERLLHAGDHASLTRAQEGKESRPGQASRAAPCSGACISFADN